MSQHKTVGPDHETAVIGWLDEGCHMKKESTGEPFVQALLVCALLFLVGLLWSVGAASAFANTDTNQDRTAFAVYSDTDDSLRFYKRVEVPSVGDVFDEGRVVTAVYADDIETSNFGHEVQDADASSGNGGATRDFEMGGATRDIGSSTRDMDGATRDEGAVRDEGATRDIDLGDGATRDPVSVGAPWAEHAQAITSVKVVDSIAPVSLAYWFAGDSSRRLSFDRCTEFDLSALDTSNVVDMYQMFFGASAVTRLDLSSFKDVAAVKCTAEMFSGCTKLQSVLLPIFDAGSLTDISAMFSGCESLSSLNLAGMNMVGVTDMHALFSGCTNLERVVFSSDHAALSVTNLQGMFYACEALEEVSLSVLSLARPTNLSNMFFGCSNLVELDLTQLNTDDAYNLNGMFSGCSSLASLDLSQFDTSNATDIAYLFANCTGLHSIDTARLDTSNVTSMKGGIQRMQCC